MAISHACGEIQLSEGVIGVLFFHSSGVVTGLNGIGPLAFLVQCDLRHDTGAQLAEHLADADVDVRTRLF